MIEAIERLVIDKIMEDPMKERALCLNCESGKQIVVIYTTIGNIANRFDGNANSSCITINSDSTVASIFIAMHEVNTSDCPIESLRYVVYHELGHLMNGDLNEDFDPDTVDHDLVEARADVYAMYQMQIGLEGILHLLDEAEKICISLHRWIASEYPEDKDIVDAIINDPERIEHNHRRIQYIIDICTGANKTAAV